MTDLAVDHRRHHRNSNGKREGKEKRRKRRRIDSDWDATIDSDPVISAIYPDPHRNRCNLLRSNGGNRTP